MSDASLSGMTVPAGTLINFENRIGTSRVRVVTSDGTEITFISIKGSTASIRAAGDVSYYIEENIAGGIGLPVDNPDA